MKAPRLILAALLLAFASNAGAQTGPGSALTFNGVTNQVTVTNYGNLIPTNEITVFRDGRAIVKGTDDISVARSLYAKFIGS